MHFYCINLENTDSNKDKSVMIPLRDKIYFGLFSSSIYYAFRHVYETNIS